MPSVFSRLTKAARRNPLALATVLCTVLVGGTIAVTNRSKKWSVVDPDTTIQAIKRKGLTPDGLAPEGVGFSYRPSRFRTDAIYHRWCSSGTVMG